MKKLFTPISKTVLLIGIGLGALQCKAQSNETDAPKIYYWLGADWARSTVGQFVNGSANVLINNYALGFEVGKRLDHSTSVNDIDREYALTGGLKLSDGRYSNVLFSLGFSLDNAIKATGGTFTDGLNSFTTANESQTTFGVPIELRYLNNYGLGGIGGLSAAARVNITSGTTFTSLSIGITIGKLRDRDN